MPVEQFPALSNNTENSPDPLVIFEALSPQERAFSLAYVTCYDHAQAAQEVGLSRDRGLRLINKPLVSQFIAHLQQDQEQYMVINRAFVQAKALELWPKINGEEPVAIVDRDGIEKQACKFHAADAVSLLTFFGKHAGFSQEKSTRHVTINIDLERMGIDESKSKNVSVTLDASDGEFEEIP